MPISIEEINLLLPKEVPLIDLTGSEISTLNRLREQQKETLRRSFLWSRWLTREVFGPFLNYSQAYLYFARTLPRFLGLSIGFIPLSEYVPRHEFISSVSWEIGWVFTVAAIFEGRFKEENRAFTFRTGIDLQFPFLILAVDSNKHISLNPDGATSSCWAISQKAHIHGKEGILTAKHAIIGSKRGYQVILDDGNYGTLEDFCEGGVDAAFISINSLLPSNKTDLSISNHPVNGEDSFFYGEESKQKIRAQIVNSIYYPDNPDPYNSWRVMLDYYSINGQEGDSGALVYEEDTGNAFGIYTGEMPTGGKVLGMSQYLRQAVDLLNLKLYV